MIAPESRSPQPKMQPDVNFADMKSLKCPENKNSGQIYPTLIVAAPCAERHGRMCALRVSEKSAFQFDDATFSSNSKNEKERTLSLIIRVFVLATAELRAQCCSHQLKAPCKKKISSQDFSSAEKLETETGNDCIVMNISLQSVFMQDRKAGRNPPPPPKRKDPNDHPFFSLHLTALPGCLFEAKNNKFGLFYRVASNF